MESSDSSSGTAQLLTSIFFFFLGNYLMAIAGDLTDEIYFRYYCLNSSRYPDPLPDILSHPSKFVINFLKKKNIAMVTITDPLIALLPLIFFLSLFTNDKLKGRRKVLASRLFIVWGFCTFLRALCLTTTVLPSFHNDICPALIESRKKYGHLNIFISGFLHLSAPISQYYPMADYMFSGHAAGATSVYIVTLFDVFDRSYLFGLKAFLFTLCYLLCIASIILTRLHYTADVLIGVFISIFSYLLYHLMVEKCKTKKLIFPYTLVNWIEKQDFHIE